jgi:hypothetical protein
MCAVKVSSLLRHLKKIKAAEKSNSRLLMPDGTTYTFPNGKGFLKACVDCFERKSETSDMRAVRTATASNNGGNLITLLRMLDEDDEELCD